MGAADSLLLCLLISVFHELGFRANYSPTALYSSLRIQGQENRVEGTTRPTPEKS